LLGDREDLLDGGRPHGARPDALVRHEDDPVAELEPRRRVPAGDRDARVLHLEQAPVRAEDRDRPVVRHLAGLHRITLAGAEKKAFSFKPTHSGPAAGGSRYFRRARRMVPLVPRVRTLTGIPPAAVRAPRSAIVGALAGWGGGGTARRPAPRPPGPLADPAGGAPATALDAERDVPVPPDASLTTIRTAT